MPILRRFIVQLYRERPDEAHLESLAARLSEFAIVAEEAREVVGFLIAEKRSTRDGREEIGRDAFPSAESYLEIQELFVDPEYRDRGIGTALMREVLARGEAAGIKRSMVYSGNADYARIAKFYERCGFRMWQIFMTR